MTMDHRSPLRRLAVRFAAVLLIAGSAGLGGCSTLGLDDDPEDTVQYVERPVEQIYNNALEKLYDRDWRNAALQFEEVERQHPYSVWARRAILMGAYCYYQANKYDQAINAADRFIALHPGNKDAPYAYYLKSISLYEQIVDVGRDQNRTEQALASLYDLVKRYPTSAYARDARLKVDLTIDHLAGKEMAIGRYYLKRGQFVAAINRFRIVVEKFQQTSHTPEALHRLTEAYLAMGIKNEAQTAAAVLGHNYPGSPWYQDSYALLADQGLEPDEDEDSWISKVWGSVF